jgi:outer membrane lipoprotein-sorting protein
MIFGKMKNRTKKITTLLFITLSVMYQSVSADGGYAEILKKLSRSKPTVVEYEESFDAFYLNEPVLSSGEMKFYPPDKLIKVTLNPDYIQQEITGNEVITTWKDGKNEVFSLDRHRGLKSMANTLRAVLSGNISYIRNTYEVEKRNVKEGWEIVLVPKESGIEKWIKNIVLQGENKNIEKFIVTEANGDRTTTTLHEK